MRILLLLAALFVATPCFAADNSGTADDNGAARMMPSVETPMVFFYYRNLEKAIRFYGSSLGFKQLYRDDKIALFEIHPNMTLGLISEGAGYHAPPKASPAVMLSLTTPDIEDWYKRIKDQGDITILKELTTQERGEDFLIADSEGYTVEFFRWVNRPY